jgi:N-formylglutamate amidohydrolase
MSHAKQRAGQWIVLVLLATGLSKHTAAEGPGTLRETACGAPQEVVAGTRYQPGQTYYGREHYIEYLAGDLPVILSAPHGGRLRPEEIPDRTEGTFAFDTNTQELARAVAQAFYARTGHWPHVVICRLHRRKVDCNREIREGAAGHPLAEQAWREFQGFLEAARAQVVRTHGRGLYLDLHGHGHRDQRLELGYLHRAAELDVDDAALDAPSMVAQSSLRALALRGHLPYSALVRGPYSLGALLEAHGFPCTPSPSHPRPRPPYFSGGYNTVQHGREAAPLFGLQIETHYRGVRDTEDSRTRFAQALVASVETFLMVHAGIDLARPAGPRTAPAPPMCAPRRVRPMPLRRLVRRIVHAGC